MLRNRPLHNPATCIGLRDATLNSCGARQIIGRTYRAVGRKNRVISCHSLESQKTPENRALEASVSSEPIPPEGTTDESLGDIAKGVVQPETSAQSVGAFVLLLSPFFFWGTSMVAMKALSPHTAPLFVSAFRMLPAGLALIAWAAKDGRPQPEGWKAWAWILAFGLADATAFQGFLAIGLQKTAAGLGSVIIDSQPLSVAVLAAFLFGERINAYGYAGLFLGILGLCFLELSPDSLTPLLSLQVPDLHLNSGGSVWESGEFFMLLAAPSLAVGRILVRYVSKYADPVMATGYHMLLGGIPLFLLSAQQETNLLSERLPLLTGSDLLLLAYISLLGSAASYGVFFYNASKGNLTALSSLTFSTPCFAAATGYLFFGESLTPLQLFGAAVTLVGVFLISRPQDS